MTKFKFIDFDIECCLLCALITDFERFSSFPFVIERGYFGSEDTLRIFDFITSAKAPKPIGFDILKSYFAEVQGSREFIKLIQAKQNVIKSDETVKGYISVLRKLHLKRSIEAFVEKVAEQNGSSMQEGDATIAYILQHGEALAEMCKQRTESNGENSGIFDFVYESIESAALCKSKYTGVSTGFRLMDEATAGLRKGNLIVLGGRPSVGKTAFAINVAYNIVKDGGAVLFISLEMLSVDIAARFLSLHSSVSLNDMYNKEKMQNDAMRQHLRERCEQLGKFKIHIDGEARNLTAIKAAIVKTQKNNKLSLVVIDYIQLVEAFTHGSAGRLQETTAITAGLKKLANTCGVPIIALSQLTREVDARRDNTPKLSDFRDSGSIEQDADIAIFLHPSQYDEGKVNLIIAKNRNGRKVDKIDLTFVGQNMRFEEN